MIRRDISSVPSSLAWLAEGAVSTCKTVGSKHLPTYVPVGRFPSAWFTFSTPSLADQRTKT
jgi:hypothetical protein